MTFDHDYAEKIQAAKNRDLLRKSELSAGLDAQLSQEQRTVVRCKLIYQCARLLKSRPSPFAEDWPKTMPKSALRKMEELDERMSAIASEIREIIKRI